MCRVALPLLLLLLLLLLLVSLAAATATATTAAALAPKQQSPPALSPPSTAIAGSGVSSSSVLVALLDSQYTELSELAEKASLLQPLEAAVVRGNVTILAPRNEALERDLYPELRRFLLEPRNLPSLQTLLLFHVLPARLRAASLLQPPRSRSHHHPTLAAGEPPLDLAAVSRAVTRPDAAVRADGVIHGLDRLLVPRSVQDAFNRRRRRRSLAASVSAALPTGAPVVVEDPRTHRRVLLRRPAGAAAPASPPALPAVWDAMAPGPAIAPAPAPGPGTGAGRFDGDGQVQDLIETLLLTGGYSELADILVNLTTLAAEMGRLVSEGYVLTVLAPSDEAMARLTTEQLGSSSPEDILYYHVIPEYQTEESMYGAVRRFGKVRYDTLRLPLKVTAREADGSVRFGAGGAEGGSAYLFDPDIYTDGRISVQGIDAVLFPPAEELAGGKRPAAADAPTRKAPAVAGPAAKPKLRRGKLLEGACRLMGFFVRRSRLASCQ